MRALLGRVNEGVVKNNYLSSAHHKSLHLNLNSDGLPDTTKHAAKWSLPFQKNQSYQSKQSRQNKKRYVTMNHNNIINSYETRYGNEIQNTPFPQD